VATRPSSFTVTSAGQRVRLDSNGAGQASFTVTNTSAQALKGRMLTRPSAPAEPEWFSIVGEPDRDFAPNAAQQVVAQLNVPPTAPPGSYSFRLDAVSQAEPDEDFTEGPSISFDVEAPVAPKKKRFPWWIIAVAAGIVLLIVIGIVVFLLVRDDGDSRETAVSSGTGTIPGTFLFDVDSGAVTQTGADLFWRQRTDVLRQMEPQGTATLVNLGVRNFDSITGDELSKLNYSTAPILANDDRTNQLVNGDVFAVRSTDGNFAKVKVLSYGRNLGVQWVTFRLAG
jgi:hypothetical protein